MRDHGVLGTTPRFRLAGVYVKESELAKDQPVSQHCWTQTLPSLGGHQGLGGGTWTLPWRDGACSTVN